MSLEEFMANSLNEEKLEKTYTDELLNLKYKKFKKELDLGKIKLQIYIDQHAEDRFHERFVTGDKPLDLKKYDYKLFKDLPNWKPLEWKDYNKVLLNGLNKIIQEHKLAFGGYFIISESTRLVIPAIIGRYENFTDRRVFVINSTLHTGMSNIDTFHLGNKVYDHDDIKVEEFFAYLHSYYKGSYGILEEENLVDHELGVQLEYTVEGEYTIETNYPIVIVK